MTARPHCDHSQTLRTHSTELLNRSRLMISFGKRGKEYITDLKGCHHQTGVSSIMHMGSISPNSRTSQLDSSRHKKCTRKHRSSILDQPQALMGGPLPSCESYHFKPGKTGSMLKNAYTLKANSRVYTCRFQSQCYARRRPHATTTSRHICLPW